MTQEFVKDGPTLDILLATRNRASLLALTLEAIVRQASDAPPFRIIVVDNGSTDNTQSVVQAIKADVSVIYVSEPKLGKNSALNRGLAEVVAPLVVFTDDDIIPKPGWLQNLALAAERWPGHDVFAGAVEPRFPAAAARWLKMQHRWSSLWFASFLPTEETEGKLGCGPNFAVRSSVFENVKFDESIGPAGMNYAMGSETEFMSRFLGEEGRLVLVPSSVVYHVIQPQQLELRWLLGRSFRAGRGAVRADADKNAPILFGCPRWIWRTLIERFVSVLLTLPKGKKKITFALADLYYVRGQIHEYRLISK